MSDKAFRKIRPSFADGGGKASSSTQSNADNSGSSEGRRNKEQDNPKRRKTPESITRNACLNCKKARAKCDGRIPCNRCASRAEVSECIYEIHIKHTKEELVKEIKHLQAQNFLDHQIFQALSADDRVPEILDMLQRGQSHESILKSIGRTLPDELADLSLMASPTSMVTLEMQDHEMEDANYQTIRWTSVTANRALLDHLFQLYFAWVHPVHSLFDEGHFVNSYHNGDRYCSPALMNSLCAMACHLHAKSGDDVLSFARLAEEFIEAVRNVIDPEDVRITTIQAFSVMFLVEMARGNGLLATSYLKIAAANLPRVPIQDRETARAVWRSTVQGIRNLNVEWAQITFQVPSRVDIGNLPDDDGNDDQRNGANWHFYSKVSDRVPAWPSHQATISREKANLIQIIEDMTVALYSQHGPRISAQHVLELYGRLVRWRNALPDVIGNMEVDKATALPHALSLLILYSNSIVHLLRPLLNFDGFPSHLVEDIIWHHAQKGMSLLNDRYREQFTCRWQPVLQMFSMLHFADVIARYFPGGIEGRCKDGPESIKACIEMLAESAKGFPIAPLMQEMLRKTAVACSIRIPASVSEASGFGLAQQQGQGQHGQGQQQLPAKAYQTNDFIHACTRPSYIQPVEEIRRRFLPTLIADWLAHSGEYGFVEPTLSTLEKRKTKTLFSDEPGAPQGLMQISSLLNSP